MTPPAVVAPERMSWPPAPATSLVLLHRAATDVEERIVATYAEELRAHGASVVTARAGADAAVAGKVIAPVRVVWLGGADRLRLRELPLQAGPRRSRAQAQRLVLDRTPERCRVVVGDPAGVEELEARWSERGGRPDRAGFGAFIERQAEIVLSRAERRLTGERYRAPQHVADEVLSDRRFTAAAGELATALGRDPAGVIADAGAYLAEMATEQQRLARDLWTSWAKFLYSRAYELDVDPAQIEALRELAAKHPLVFLPSHRSNLDGYVMASVLHEHGLPPNHTLGGINMAFWPLGPVGRRVGVIWIRRTFRDNEVYKLVLRHYLGYLVRKRFNLEWYIEGGRSRTGKLLPPRLGLFNYLADAVEELAIEDARVIPVSIVYDELQEVSEMTAESHGSVKAAEGLGWLVRFARAQQGSFGAVRVNFGQPLALAESLRAHGSAPQADVGMRRLARSKAAFEVCMRINRATPVTTTSLLALAMLGSGDRALTLPEVRAIAEPFCAHVRVRGIPGQEAIAALSTSDGVLRTLATLEEHGVVESFAGGPEAVFRIGRELDAAFYRNAAIHWFLPRAIVELALLAAVEAQDPDATRVALDDALRTRDLLKFDFFFPEKDAFRHELRDEMGLIDPDWREPGRLEEIGSMLTSSGVLTAHLVLRSFVEAYAIVATHLASLGGGAADADSSTQACLQLGRQFRWQRRVGSAEAVSTHLFSSALKLAANRGLLEPGGNVAVRRVAFQHEIDDVLRRLDRLAGFAEAAA